MSAKLGWAIGWFVMNTCMIVSGGSIGWTEGFCLWGMSCGALGWATGGYISALYIRHKTSALHTEDIVFISASWLLSFLLFLIFLHVIPILVVKVGLNGVFIMSISGGLAGAVGGLCTGIVLQKFAAGIQWNFKMTATLIIYVGFAFSLGICIGLISSSLLSQLINRLFAPIFGWWFGHVLGWGLGGAFGGYIAGSFGIERPVSKFRLTSV